jgi:hypothetical protein
MAVDPPIPFRVVSVAMPVSEAERHRVCNVPEARRFSKDWQTEFFVSRDVAAKAKLDAEMTAEILNRVSVCEAVTPNFS